MSAAVDSIRLLDYSKTKGIDICTTIAKFIIFFNFDPY